MRRTVRVTDLTQADGEPGQRADPRLERTLEKCMFKIKMPGWLGGAAIEIDTRTRDGSRLANAIITFLVVVTGCLSVAAMIGVNAAGTPVPSWVTIGSFLVPAGIYAILSIPGRRSRRSRK